MAIGLDGHLAQLRAARVPKQEPVQTPTLPMADQAVLV
jgi:hypothetical protein